MHISCFRLAESTLSASEAAVLKALGDYLEV